MALYIGIKNLIGKGAAWLRSKWSTVVTQLAATFRYRVAGGEDNALLPKRNGRAVIDTIYGNTVKFNQLVQAVNANSMIRYDSSTAKYISTATQTNYSRMLYPSFSNIPSGEVVYILYEFISNFTSKPYFRAQKQNTSQYFNVEVSNYVQNTWLKCSAIVNEGINQGSSTTGFLPTNGNFVQGEYIAFKNNTHPLQFISLTKIFGTDAEIAAALGITTSQITQAEGVAAFEAWLALNPGYQDYYPYDEGSLISFTGSGVKVTGWNKFNINTMWGSYGTIVNNVITLTSAAYNQPLLQNIKFLPNTQYYFSYQQRSLSGNNIRLQIYYADGTLEEIGRNNTNTFVLLGKLSAVGKTVENVKLIYGNSGTIEIKEFCINIHDTSSPSKDGTYEPYKEEIVDLSGAYINVWDEIPAYGTFSGSDGETFTPNSGYLASQNKIKVVGGKTYYFKINQSFRVFYYDASGTFISSTPINATATSITLDSNVGYIRFQRGISGTYAHDICINVSNTDINGTYYPHALQSAGSVTDEDTETELTKKVGMVDLGTLLWRYAGGKFQCDNPEVLGMRPLPTGAALGYNLQCAKYTPSSATTWNTMTGDMEIGSSGGGALRLTDSQYGASSITDGHASFLEGVFLIYELATPVVVPHDTPMQYAVDKYSTEELLVPASVAGEPTSTAIVADIEYQAK